MHTQTKAYSVLVFATIVLAIIVTISTFYLTDKTLKELLVIRAQTIATLIDQEAIAHLSGSTNDLYQPEYNAVKMKLATLREVNTQSRFIYLMRNTPQGIIFLIDSEPSTSEDYSPPGQIYDEASPQLINAITKGIPGWEIAQDRWGMWITGYAPILDETTGAPLALVGIDFDYYLNYLLPIIGFTAIPVLAFGIILLLISYSQKLQLAEQKAIDEKEQLLHIASHEIETPVAETQISCEELLETPVVASDERTRFFAKQMYSSLTTLVRRTTNLLKTIELTVPQKVSMKELDLIPLLQQSIESHEKIAGLRDVSFQITGTFPVKAVIKGREEYIQLIIDNLIEHVIYYTQKKESVMIDFEESEKEYTISATSNGDTITDAEVKTLFSAYHKGEPVSNHTQSTGLGLYLIQKIAMMHQGSVSVSKNEQGVTITISLPKK